MRGARAIRQYPALIKFQNLIFAKHILLKSEASVILWDNMKEQLGEQEMSEYHDEGVVAELEPGASDFDFTLPPLTSHSHSGS